MQGWLYGNGMIYLAANILASKISLTQDQGYTEYKTKWDKKIIQSKIEQVVRGQSSGLQGWKCSSNLIT